MSESREIQKLKEEIERLKQGNASLRRIAREKLGEDYFGISPERLPYKMTHDELIFIFAKIHDSILGFEKVICIRQEFPDGIAIKNGERKLIEFEVKASDFKAHISSSRHDIANCNCIVCWENDIDSKSSLKSQIEESGIEIIELKPFWEKLGEKKSRDSKFRHTEKDIRNMSSNGQKVIKAFLDSKNRILSTQDLQNETEIKGKAIGGVLQGLINRNGDWLIRQTSKGHFEFNSEYRDVAVKAINHK